MRAWAAIASASLATVGCRDWNPVRNLTTGEGLQQSRATSVRAEGGADLPRLRGPAFSETGPQTTRDLADTWKPVPLATKPERCFALTISFEPRAEPERFAEHARRAETTFVIRGPDGSVVARLDEAYGTIGRCNWEGWDTHTLDVMPTKRGFDRTKPLGKGTLVVRMFERALDAREQWELDARRTALLHGGGVALHDPEKVRRASGVRATRRLESFEPVDVGPLAPEDCIAATIRATPATRPNPEAKVFDAPFVFDLSDPETLFAHRLQGGALVTEEVCNPTATPIAHVPLRMVRREGAPPPGEGPLEIEAFVRPLHLAAPKTRFLAGGVLSPMSGASYDAEGAPVERSLDHFEPVPISVAPGRCDVVRIRSNPGVSIRPGATMYSHPFYYASRGRGDSPLAQTEENGVMVMRPFCNGSSDPWPLALSLGSRDGTAPGSGRVTIEVLSRAMQKSDW